MKAKAKILVDFSGRPTVITFKGRKIIVQYDPRGLISSLEFYGRAPPIPEMLSALFTVTSNVKLGGMPFYDRNPVHHTLFHESYGAAPHASTLQESFTVPANKLAIVQATFIHTRRVTAAAPVGLVVIDINTFIEKLNRPIQRVMHSDNNVNYIETRTQSYQMLLKEADQLRIYTLDTSTGGTNDYVVTVVFTTFDA